jgi:hypothetical protein
MLRRVLSSMRFGIVAVVLVVVGALALEALWGPVYGRYGWQQISIAVLFLGIVAVAGLEEFVRPRSPYMNVEPLFDLRDAGPRGTIYSSSPSLLWNSVPPLVTIVVLIAWQRLT